MSSTYEVLEIERNALDKEVTGLREESARLRALNSELLEGLKTARKYVADRSNAGMPYPRIYTELNDLILRAEAK